MLANIASMLSFFGANYGDIIVWVVIMVSAIIVAIGLLKPLLFNKITNKYVRRAVLAFSNVAACFVVAFVYFVANGWNLQYYFLSALALSVCSIVTYWFYENTNLRGVIGVIGNIAIRKLANIAVLTVTTEDANAVKAELKKTSAELKANTRTELKKAATTIKEDKDLQGL